MLNIHHFSVQVKQLNVTSVHIYTNKKVKYKMYYNCYTQSDSQTVLEETRHLSERLMMPFP